MGLFFVSMLRRMDGEKSDGVWMQQLCLALLFLMGAAGGYAYALSCAEQSAPVLKEYLEGYCQLFLETGEGTVSVFSAVRLYYVHALLTFFFGFTALGVLVIPAVVASSGFSAMFAIACFTRVYGRSGALLALSALGLRLCVTVPCLLWIGAYAWSAASALVSRGRGKRCVPVLYDGRYFSRFVVCIMLLLIGVFAECYVTPSLFHLALETL